MALIRATTIARMAAAKNPVVLKPANRLSTNSTIKTVMIKDMRPSVSKFNGNVSILNIKPIVALANAISKAARMAVPNPLTCTPGTR